MAEKVLPLLFFIDVEFCTGYGGKIWLLEIAILNSRGRCVYHTKIGYETTVQKLFDHPDMAQKSVGARKIC